MSKQNKKEATQHRTGKRFHIKLVYKFIKYGEPYARPLILSAAKP